MRKLAGKDDLVIKQAQKLLDRVVAEATEVGFPPELTHKQGYLDCSNYRYPTTAHETVVNMLIGAYESKWGLITVFTILADIWNAEIDKLSQELETNKSVMNLTPN